MVQNKEEEGSTRLTSTENISDDEQPLLPTLLEERGQNFSDGEPLTPTLLEQRGQVFIENDSLTPTLQEQRGEIILLNPTNPTIPGNCRDDANGKNDNGTNPPVSTILENGVSKIIDIKRYSDIKKLFRVTAWTTRFKSKILKKIKKNNKENEDKKENINKNNIETAWAEELTGEEINEAKKLWV